MRYVVAGLFYKAASNLQTCWYDALKQFSGIGSTTVPQPPPVSDWREASINIKCVISIPVGPSRKMYITKKCTNLMSTLYLRSYKQSFKINRNNDITNFVFCLPLHGRFAHTFHLRSFRRKVNY